jgi:hypothetical protein
MGEEREDPQRLKRIAADSYDYDNDPRWRDYWDNVLIPPSLSSRSDVVSHYKRKFYQRFVVRISQHTPISLFSLFCPFFSPSSDFFSVWAIGSLSFAATAIIVRVF